MGLEASTTPAGRGKLESAVHQQGEGQQKVLVLSLSDLGQTIINCGFQTSPMECSQ